MPALLKRILFQVGPVPNERAFVFSSVSNDGHFISLRPLIKPRSTSEEEFPFEWAFAGTNSNVSVSQIKENVVSQDFNFWFDANVYLNVPNTHRGEIKTIWETWESGCIAETGFVFPAGSDKEGVPFLELWQPLDPNKREMVIVSDENRADGAAAKSVVFKTAPGSGYDGLVVATGKWAQGFLSKQNDGTIKGLNFIRTLERDGSPIADATMEFGKDTNKFPRVFNGVKLGDVVDVNGLKWEVIESYL